MAAGYFPPGEALALTTAARLVVLDFLDQARAPLVEWFQAEPLAERVDEGLVGAHFISSFSTWRLVDSTVMRSDDSSVSSRACRSF